MTAAGAAIAAASRLDSASAARYGAMALAGIDREFPGIIHHVMADAGDVARPSLLTPVFYGCYDWHSAVHGHWLLVRLLRLHPDSAHGRLARAALAARLTPAGLRAEAAYVAHPQRGAFERPYGLAWVLQLAAELDESADPQLAQWREALRPLEAVAVERLSHWLPVLRYPIRSGEHSQTAFAFGLVLDYALQVGDRTLHRTVAQAAHRFHDDDRDGPLAYEPSGQDFLSPCLAQADLMRRLLLPADFAAWLGRFLPSIGHDDWLPLARSSDRTDGKLAHLDGLNLSRAWMLEGIAAGLPDADARRPALLACAASHAAAGLDGADSGHYAGSHWLGSFAVYLLSGRGLPR
jgi:hypothetical protein